jgi:crotonobetainyl-CoA:carnitine CoA-transferase CaiB-like acyl-CoA transferase
MGTQIADIAGGSLHGVVGILAAVNYRAQSGEGQHVDVSMTDAAFSMNLLYGTDYLASRREPEPEAELLNGGSFYDYYETADGRYMSVGSLEPHFFQRLCMTLGGEALCSEGAKQDPARQRAFKARLAEIFKGKTFREWCEIFADQDACVEPVLKFSEACRNEQIQHRGMVVPVPTEAGAQVEQIAHPIKMSRCKPVYRFAGGRLGAHNREVLEETGLDDSARERLLASGAMGRSR